MDKTKWRFIVGVLVALAVVVSACAPSTAEPEAVPETEAGPTEPSAEESGPVAETEGEQRVFVYADVAPYSDLDPRVSFSDDNRIMSNVYEPLVWYNPPGSPEVLTPALATSWEHNADGTEWTFHLREGVTFHDGAPFNAEAVKTSIEKTTELGLGAAFIWWMVEEIEAVDEYTVTFHLSSPAALDVIASSGYGAWIYSPEAADQPSEWFDQGNDAGTGPYMIESYEPGSRVVLTKFEDYWGAWEGDQFDKAIYHIVEEGSTRMQMIQSGEANFTWLIPYENLPALEANPNLEVQANASMFNVFGRTNNAKPPLDNVVVRRALAYSFPYEACAESGHSGYLVRSHGAIPPGVPGHSEELFQYSFDLDKARELLAEAGYPDGGFSLDITTDASDPARRQCGELWKAELDKLGIEADFQLYTWTAQWELAKGDVEETFHYGINWWWPTYVTAYDWLYNLYHCEEEVLFNWSRYCNPQFDELIDTAVSLEATDMEAAEEMYIEAQKILIEDSVDLFIGDLKHVVVFTKDIQGYVDNPAYPSVVFVYQLHQQ